MAEAFGEGARREFERGGRRGDRLAALGDEVGEARSRTRTTRVAYYYRAVRRSPRPARYDGVDGYPARAPPLEMMSDARAGSAPVKRRIMLALCPVRGLYDAYYGKGRRSGAYPRLREAFDRSTCGLADVAATALRIASVRRPLGDVRSEVFTIRPNSRGRRHGAVRVGTTRGLRSASIDRPASRAGPLRGHALERTSASSSSAALAASSGVARHAPAKPVSAHGRDTTAPRPETAPELLVRDQVSRTRQHRRDPRVVAT